MPIFVRVKNVNSSNSYIIGKEDISVYDGSRQSSASSDAKVDAKANAAAVSGTVMSVLAMVAPGGVLWFGASLAAGKMVWDATVVKHNMTDKQFLSTTLAPGQEGSGFLYFELPQNTEKPSTWNVRINAKNPNSNEIVFVELSMDLEK